MKRIRFLRQKEVDIKLRHEWAERPRKLVPWWARALRRVGMRRVLRQQTTGSLSGSRASRIRAAEPPTSARRSVVKASFSRNAKKGAWTAHAKYLSRPGAQQEIAKGLGFDSTREQIDMIATVRGWERSDELMWRFIVSPEDANRLNLRDHVRELVGAMERDLGTKLEWVAIDHHNTDDAHVHLLVRGVRDNRWTLKIDREYLRSGVRMRSQEIATRELGPRLEPEMLHARERVIRREQWTEIDRAIQHKADASRIVSYEHFRPRSEGAQIRAEQEMERLDYLARLGLAQRIDERSWQLSENHERELRDRQQSKDVVKTRARERQRQTGAAREFER